MAWVRARQLQLLLGHIDRLPAVDRLAVRKRIPAADVDRVQEAGVLDWIPMKLSADMARAVTEQLGAERARTFFRDQFAVTLEGSVLGSLVAAVTRYAAANPRAALRWLPRGHDMLFREVGRLLIEVERDEPAADLQLVELPVELASDGVWLDRYAWSLESLHVLVGSRIDCALVEARAAERTARFRLSWRETRPRLPRVA